MLYGGFPWFPAYCYTCEKLSLWGETGFALYIQSSNNNDCLKKIIAIKNKYRDDNVNKTFKLSLDMKHGLGYDGIIHSFHSPNPIENSRHSDAIQNAILMEMI